MTKLWTGEVFKEDPTPAEIEAGYNNLKLVLKSLRQEIRPDMSPDEEEKLLDAIDRHIGYLDASAAALNACEVRAALADRARLIDELDDEPATSS